MALTGINSEDRLVQATFAAHLKGELGWESVYAFNDETFGAGGTLGRKDATEAVLTRDLRAALTRLNSELPPSAIDDALRALDYQVKYEGIVADYNSEKDRTTIEETFIWQRRCPSCGGGRPGLDY